MDIKKIIFLTTIALAVAVNGCSRSNASKGNAPAPVLTAKAVEKNMPVQIEPPPVGHVTPVQSVTIRSQIGGTISAVHFQEGQEVKAGDPLFTIDPRPSQAAL